MTSNEPSKYPYGETDSACGQGRTPQQQRANDEICAALLVCAAIFGAIAFGFFIGQALFGLWAR